MNKKTLSVYVVLLFTLVLLAACGNGDKAPAELAMKAAEEAVNMAKAEAGKIVPDQVAQLESALASAKDKLAKKDFKAALAEAQGLTGKAKDVLAAAKAKKDELAQKWADLSQGLPGMVAAIQSRVDILSEAKNLPGDMTTEKLAEVKSGLAAVKEDWARAQENFNSGNLADALSVATSVKEKAVNAMETLGMTVPEGAKL